MRDLVIGLDVGTHSTRVAVFRRDGERLYTNAINYDTEYPREHWAEQDPGDWRNAIDALMSDVRREVPANGIEAIALDSTTCTVVVTDRENNPIGKAMLWEDSRVQEEAAEIRQMAASNGFEGYGSTVPELMLPKALWLKHHDQRYQNGQILEGLDHLNWQLTGNREAVGNRTLAIRKWNYDLGIGGWDDGHLEKFGLSDVKARWPSRFAEPAEVIGTLRPELRARWGLPEAKIVGGTFDSYAHTVGLGAVEANGDAALILGGSINIYAVIGNEPSHYGTLTPCYNPEKKDLSMIGNGIIAGGLSLDWFIDNFCERERIEAERRGIKPHDILDEMIEGLPPGSGGLVFTPYLQGGSRAHGDPTMRGSFTGLSITTGRPNMYKAIYEGIAYNLRYILEDLTSKGIEINRLVAGGGGDKKSFLKIIADVTGIPIQRTMNNESAAHGSAMIAAVGAGMYGNLREARDNMLQLNGTVVPSMENHQQYAPFYQKYQELHNGALSAVRS
ncbi:MAG: FGGY family carbohydrate kinase [archaeon]